MSVPSTRNVMSVYTVDNDAASTGTLAAGTDSGEMTRSLVKAVCDMDLDQLSDEAMNDLIKKTLRSVVCKPALALKNEIVQDMELEKMEKCLRNHIQRMKIYLNTFIETQKFETEQVSKSNDYVSYLILTFSNLLLRYFYFNFYRNLGTPSILR